MNRSSHFIEVYGVRNARKGISKPDAVVSVTPRPYIANGRPQYEITIEAELAGGEGETLPPEVLTTLIQEAGKSCVNRCVADLMLLYAKQSKTAMPLNIYNDTDNKLVVGHRYKAVLVGLNTDAGKMFYLVRKSVFDAGTDETVEKMIRELCSDMGVLE